MKKKLLQWGLALSMLVGTGCQDKDHQAVRQFGDNLKDMMFGKDKRITEKVDLNRCCEEHDSLARQINLPPYRSTGEQEKDSIYATFFLNKAVLHTASRSWFNRDVALQNASEMLKPYPEAEVYIDPKVKAPRVRFDK
jgi:hypothetical protein